ncbi:hypothetical protein ATANTOWER_024324 [Ataeniobius toweri]|uniref:Uncharacterized protein n=1 Tax=Ataeniobius toweri TaxID=208326 RepID=A0ABU7AQT5_9TELE|nr:hypothetical protein [Ataeniobius toweri]
MKKKLHWSSKTKAECFCPTCKAMCEEKLTLHITMSTSSPQENMVVAASCCGDTFLQQEHGSWSEVIQRWMVKYKTRQEDGSHMLVSQRIRSNFLDGKTG